MTLRPSQLGECLVRDLAHYVATEAPAIIVDLDEAVIDQCVDIGREELLTEFCSESFKPAKRPCRTEHRSVINRDPRTRRQAVEPSSD